jgi:hypothetical protein
VFFLNTEFDGDFESVGKGQKVPYFNILILFHGFLIIDKVDIFIYEYCGRGIGYLILFCKYKSKRTLNGVNQYELYVKFKVFEHDQALEIVARRCTLGVISLRGLSFCYEPREIVIHYFIALTSIDHINFNGYFKAVPFHILQ